MATKDITISTSCRDCTAVVQSGGEGQEINHNDDDDDDDDGVPSGGIEDDVNNKDETTTTTTMILPQQVPVVPSLMTSVTSLPMGCLETIMEFLTHQELAQKMVEASCNHWICQTTVGILKKRFKTKGRLFLMAMESLRRYSQANITIHSTMWKLPNKNPLKEWICQYHDQGMKAPSIHDAMNVLGILQEDGATNVHENDNDREEDEEALPKTQKRRKIDCVSAYRWVMRLTGLVSTIQCGCTMTVNLATRNFGAKTKPLMDVVRQEMGRPTTHTKCNVAPYKQVEHVIMAADQLVVNTQYGPFMFHLITLDAMGACGKTGDAYILKYSRKGRYFVGRNDTRLRLSRQPELAFRASTINEALLSLARNWMNDETLTFLP